MKPLIHYVFTIKDDRPYKKIKTIIGKARFKSWAIKHYFEDDGKPICFQVEGWDSDLYLRAIPFYYKKGKHIGDPRVIFSEIRQSTDLDDDPLILKNGDNDDIPF